MVGEFPFDLWFKPASKWTVAEMYTWGNEYHIIVIQELEVIFAQIDRGEWRKWIEEERRRAQL